MKAFLLGTVMALAISPALADTNLWIDDTSGNIGLVDLTTGTVSNVSNTGEALTDIGFVGTQMYGTSFTGLFKIDDTTGASTAVGSYAGIGGGGMNALVGSGSNLLAASNATDEVYNVSASTGAATNNKATLLPSAGDLAFNGGNLYESAVGTTGGDDLINVTTGTNIGMFVPESGAVFGLASDGTTMFAVAGTEVFTVNLATAALTPLLDYSGHGLGTANGTAFVSESVGTGPTGAIPEPSTWAMLVLGFAGMTFFGWQRKNKRNRLEVAI